MTSKTVNLNKGGELVIKWFSRDKGEWWSIKERVAQLDAEEEVPLGGRLLERRDQLHGPVVLQVMFEDRIGDVNIAETEIVVENAHHPLFAQKRGV